jgi:hypothetical protein
MALDGVTKSLLSQCLELASSVGMMII